jgi:hypothetical protein
MHSAQQCSAFLRRARTPHWGFTVCGGCYRDVTAHAFGAWIVKKNTLLPLKAAAYWSDLEGLALARAGQLMLKLQQIDQNLASLRQERVFLHGVFIDPSHRRTYLGQGIVFVQLV